VLDDLGSRNGTYLNGSPLTHARALQPGDRIQIGYTVLEAQ
jgi:pSer/pThr/pTyr-binding forkhead associated (FHA) protein